MNNFKGGAAPVNLHIFIPNFPQYLLFRSIILKKNVGILKIEQKLRSAFSFKNQLNIFIWQVISFLANLAPPGVPPCT